MNAVNPLLQPVSAVKGVGPESAEVLGSMGILTVMDLIEYLPYRYEDYRLKDLADVQHDERVTVEGKVHSEPSLAFSAKRNHGLL